MKWSIKLATIRGTEVRVHLTFFILLAYLGIVAWMQDGPQAALGGIIFLCLLFLCVLLHEFGHATAALRYGIKTPDITLLPIGGVARLERMPRNPVHELVVAIAGPLVNVVIAGILILVNGGFPNINLEPNLEQHISLVESLLLVNIWLVLFNLIPAFPMDGGRMLRALLAMRLDYARATSLAATIGQGLAVLGGVIGFLSGHILLMVVAIFIFMAAAQEANVTKVEAFISNAPVSRAMLTDFVALPSSATLKEAVDALLAGSQNDFPVVDAGQAYLGLLTRGTLFKALAELGQDGSVRDVMTVDGPVTSPLSHLSDVFMTMNQKNVTTLAVLGPDGRTLAGLLTRENVTEYIMANSALSDYRSAHPQAV